MSQKKKVSKPGRPPLPKGIAKAKYLRVRLTPAEYQTVEDAAKASGKTVSEWIRSNLIATSAA